jgi:hypothetical protein
METDDSSTKPDNKEAQSTTLSANSTPVPMSTSTASNTAVASSTANTTPLVSTTTVKTKSPAILLPEVDLYLSLLVLLFAIDKSKHKQVILSFLIYIDYFYL